MSGQYFPWRKVQHVQPRTQTIRVPALLLPSFFLFLTAVSTLPEVAHTEECKSVRRLHEAAWLIPGIPSIWEMEREDVQAYCKKELDAKQKEIVTAEAEIELLLQQQTTGISADSRSGHPPPARGMAHGTQRTGGRLLCGGRKPAGTGASSRTRPEKKGPDDKAVGQKDY